MKNFHKAEDGIITCWCGATGHYDELFSRDSLDEYCCGTSILRCRCGGDKCVCHHHGYAECPGCENCCDNDDE